MVPAEPGTVPISDALGALGDPPPDGWMSRLGALPLVHQPGERWMYDTADDYLAFTSALLAGGTYRGERVLSRPSVTLMTSDHLSPAQKAASGFRPGYFEYMLGRGWGFGMSVLTRRTHLGPSAGSYGWSDLWTAVYQAIDD